MASKIDTLIDEEKQIEALLDMGLMEFKAAMVEYKKRLDANLLHAKAMIAGLEQDKRQMAEKIAKLERDFEAIQEIAKVKR